jgi:hypothetical protein
MGEANIRRARFSADHPYCCFCGGTSRTESIDHVPPKSVFIGKLIPNLKNSTEFPACHECNSGSRQYDQAAAMITLTSLHVDAAVNDPHFLKLLRGVSNNANSVIHEIVDGLKGSRSAKRQIESAIRTPVAITRTGKITDDVVRVLTAKLGFAYFYRSTGQIVPSSGGVLIDFKTSANMLLDGLPDHHKWDAPFVDFSANLPKKKQFQFRARVDEDKSAGIFQFVIHENLSCIAAVVTDLEEFTEESSERIIRPNFLKALPPLKSEFRTAGRFQNGL